MKHLEEYITLFIEQSGIKDDKGDILDTLLNFFKGNEQDNDLIASTQTANTGGHSSEKHLVFKRSILYLFSGASISQAIPCQQSSVDEAVYTFDGKKISRLAPAFFTGVSMHGLAHASYGEIEIEMSNNNNNNNNNNNGNNNG